MSDYYTESQMQRIEQAAYDGTMLEAGKEWERQRYEFGATEAKLAERIAELEEAQRWIPVSERLPEERTPVLTLSKDNDKPVTAILDAGFWWSNVDWALNVTHWMHLPQPPEVKE